MSPEFAQPVNRVIDYVLDVVDRIERHERPDLSQEKQSIRMDLDALTPTASNAPTQLRQELALVRRALVYWADEVLILATPDWIDIALEVDFFKERNGAWRFYEYGENDARNSSSDVIETWYSCLVLGFEGDIGEAFREHLHKPMPGGKTNPAEARQAWAAELAKQIRQKSPTDLPVEPMPPGGCEALTGGAWLQTVSACLFVVSVALVVLLAIKFAQE